MNARIGSLFSGIGGLECGLEIAGAGEVAWQCERDEWCRGILERHWPGLRRFDDVRHVPADAACDILCGGFPCQDVSIAGQRAGLDGERSGLWYEYARLVRVLRPRVVFVENVTGLLTWLGHVLGPLAALGYDAEWGCFTAAEVGAPHKRERLFVLAHTQGERRGALGEPERATPEFAVPTGTRGRGSPTAHADREDELPRARLEGRHQARQPRTRRAASPDAHGKRELQPQGLFPEVRRRPGDRGWWTSVPAVCGGHDGLPRCVDRTKRFRGLGNAVVPQQAALAWRELSERAGLT